MRQANHALEVPAIRPMLSPGRARARSVLALFLRCLCMPDARRVLGSYQGCLSAMQHDRGHSRAASRLVSGSVSWPGVWVPLMGAESLGRPVRELGSTRPENKRHPMRPSAASCMRPKEDDRLDCRSSSSDDSLMFAALAATAFMLFD